MIRVAYCSSVAAWLIAAMLAAPVTGQALTAADKDHFLGRLTFGRTQGLVSQISTVQDLDAYIDSQLHVSGAPPPPPSPVMNALVGQFPTVKCTNLSAPGDEMKLVWYQLVRALTSNDQLVEVMTLFWENHFSTSIFHSNTRCNRIMNEWREHEGFRTHALGTFYDLLLHSASSPAMLRYLNQNVSCDNGPLLRNEVNENYARELLELHALGVSSYLDPSAANYTNDGDIQNVARHLAGILLSTDPATSVDSVIYASGCNMFMQPTIFGSIAHVDDYVAPNLDPSLSLSDNLKLRVEDFLAHLCRQQQTAAFVCTKLVHYFIGDDVFTPGGPVPQVLTDCIAAWGTLGDIQAVLQVIFASSEFRGAAYRGERVKLPFESVVSMARLMDGSFGPTPPLDKLGERLKVMTDTLSASGALPFHFPSPDGYPYASREQIGTAIYWQQGAMALRIYKDEAAANPVYDNLIYEPVNLVSALYGAPLDSNAFGICTAVLDWFYPGRWSGTDFWGAFDILNETASTGVFSLWSATAPDAAERVAKLLAYVVTLSQFAEK